jgi:hypothetical protein
MPRASLLGLLRINPFAVAQVEMLAEETADRDGVIIRRIRFGLEDKAATETGPNPGLQASFETLGPAAVTRAPRRGAAG